MPDQEKYADLLVRAVPNPTEDESLLLIRTDHGWLNHADFRILINRRLKPLIESQAYSKSMPNGEIWLMFPDGTKQMRVDQFGNWVCGERVSQ